MTIVYLICHIISSSPFLITPFSSYQLAIFLHAPEFGMHVDFIRPPGLQGFNFLNDGFG